MWLCWEMHGVRVDNGHLHIYSFYFRHQTTDGSMHSVDEPIWMCNDKWIYENIRTSHGNLFTFLFIVFPVNLALCEDDARHTMCRKLDRQSRSSDDSNDAPKSRFGEILVVVVGRHAQRTPLGFPFIGHCIVYFSYYLFHRHGEVHFDSNRGASSWDASPSKPIYF